MDPEVAAPVLALLAQVDRTLAKRVLDGLPGPKYTTIFECFTDSEMAIILGLLEPAKALQALTRLGSERGAAVMLLMETYAAVAVVSCCKDEAEGEALMCQMPRTWKAYFMRILRQGKTENPSRNSPPRSPSNGDATLSTGKGKPTAADADAGPDPTQHIRYHLLEGITEDYVHSNPRRSYWDRRPHLDRRTWNVWF